MSAKPNGYGTMQIGGQERPFHVGLNQGGIFQQLHHRKGEDGHAMSLKAYGELFSPPRLARNELSADDARDFVYSALASGYQVDGLRVDFTPMSVGFWIDEADAEEIAKPFTEMLAQLTRRMQQQQERAGNAEAPTTKTAAGRKSSPKRLAKS